MSAAAESLADRRRALLESLGYGITWTDSSGGTCILRRGHERWLGHGPSLETALDDALAGALPSHLGERLLRAALDAATARAEAATGAAAAADATPTAREAGRRPSSGPEREALELPRVVEPAPRDRPAEPAAEPARPAEPSRRLTREQAHEALDRILEAIDDSLPDLATATAPRQRRQLTAWMAEARALEEALPGETEVHDRVTATARRLGLLTKLWWPGTTRVLFLDATPALACGDLFHETCGTWWDLIDRIEAELTTQQPRQPDGSAIDWQDDDALQPAPLDAQAQLAAAVAAVECLLGSIDAPPGRRPDALRREEEESLVHAACRLRWIRESDVDSETWARAYGRLRWLADDRRRSEASRLATRLDHRWRPPLSWARELGEDPEQKRRRQRLRDLLDRRTRGELEGEGLADWLEEALGLGAELPSRRLAALLHEVRGRVSTLPETELSLDDRGARRRLRKLREALDDLDGGAAEGERRALQAEVSVDEPAASAGGDPGEAERAERPAPPFGSTGAAALAAALRSRVRGRRALFVSNRKDPAAWSELESLLELDVEGSVASPRRTESACEAIAGGRHDLVLAATGFIGHSTEAALLEACRKSGATYVRTYKGRPLSILRALARELGVQPAAATAAG